MKDYQTPTNQRTDMQEEARACLEELLRGQHPPQLIRLLENLARRLESIEVGGGVRVLMKVERQDGQDHRG